MSHRRLRICDAAVLVLRETDNAAVMWGDSRLLHLIAERYGIPARPGRSIHEAWRTETRILGALARTPGELVAGFTRCGGHERMVRIFRLPESK